jgi:integrase
LTGRIVITLLTSKASQDAAEQIVIPRGDMPAACQALETWGPRSLGCNRGSACSARSTGMAHLSPKRLTGHGISAIMQTRMRRLEHRRGKTRKDAKAAAALFSGHSLRTGYATSAAAKELPSYRIEAHTRHKSADMVQGYIRESDRLGKSGLKGVGF